MPQLIKRELELSDVTSIREHFWTDSQVVPGYVSNESKRFKVFVANRAQLICYNSNINQWHYVHTKSNQGDNASINGSGCGKYKEGPKVV